MAQTSVLIEGTEFEIVEQDILGHGAYGYLYRGHERSTDRDVAVRILTPPGADSAGSLLSQVRRLGESLASLESYGVVPIMGSGEWRGKVFYAMELLIGESLATCIAQSHRFTTDEIIHVAEGIAGGLRMAWKNGLAPCGIKPTNVFLTTQGAIRMADLGLPKFLSESIQVSMARALGRYVAPEQVFGEPADIRSDLYSLGVILYELATRKLPFEGYDSTTSFYYQLLHVDPAAPRELGASIPRELERVVMRCLAKSPSDRYQTPDELLEDLQAIRRRQDSPKSVSGVIEDDPGDFDIYEDQVIGEGGMGILYRGRQHSLGRPVAVKVIRDIFTASPEFVQRFRQEAELLAQVNHPNVVQVFGTGTWRGRLFYAMELVEGQDIATRLREKLHFSHDEVLHIAEGVARALAAAWKFRIVHRDIKPSNILLTPDGSVKVADFGLAKSLRITKSDSRLIAGTSEYISPEQGMGRSVDIRSDLYSLGVVLYELLMGRPPFKSDGSFTFVVYQHVHSAPPPLEPMTGSAAIPGAVKEIIQKCLEKKPENRFQTPEEMLSAVVKARGAIAPRHKPVTLRSPTANPAMGVQAPLISSVGGPYRASALIMVMLLGAGCALFAVLRRRGPDSVPAARSGEFAIFMGIGDYDSAMRFAENRWGTSSREYRSAAAGRTAAVRLSCELRAQEALHRHDWKGASKALEEALAGAGPDHDAQVRSALQMIQELDRAHEMERIGNYREAIEIYRKWSHQAPFLEPYFQACIARLQREVESFPK